MRFIPARAGNAWKTLTITGPRLVHPRACEELHRVAFALDCSDREAMNFLATTGGIRGEDVRDLMAAAFEHRFGRIRQERPRYRNVAISS